MLKNMLKRTFIHLPEVGPRREAHFWRQGIETWEDLLAAQRVYGLSRDRVQAPEERFAGIPRARGRPRLLRPPPAFG